MTPRVYSAPWVLAGRAAAGATPAALRDGAVALEGDRVLAAGPRAAVEERFGAGERLDAVILPALVNAHLHLELSHMAGRVAGGEGLPAWIHLFISARALPRPEEEAAQAMIMSAEDMVRAGVAAVGDVSNTLGSVAPLAAAGFSGTVYQEVFGVTPARIEAALASARAARAACPPAPGLRIALSPHAVYSTHGATLGQLLAAGPASIHLAEDPAERALCATGTGDFARMFSSLGAARSLRPRARSAVAFVAEHLAPHHLAVHCVDVDEDDVALLARTGATVVLCPRSNRFIVGKLPPVAALLAAGVPLAVGTDSLASCPSLSPLADLALLRRELPEIPAATLLRLAWNGPAVGAPHVGALAPGAAPGVLAAPLEGARVEDPFDFVVSAFGAEERPFTWLARPRAEALA
ncbi:MULTISPECIES: amidohydrolase family protein [Anaeromyxobacter]|uniref:amidohydrolase family protein n=1 Tax=Anaeromyxobacter TaxID=161492 RepID=UPI001F560C9C|nr:MULTISPECIES: amidohydrolase family protein [unclassified Anaeromyxobacter]